MFKIPVKQRHRYLGSFSFEISFKNYHVMITGTEWDVTLKSFKNVSLVAMTISSILLSRVGSCTY